MRDVHCKMFNRKEDKMAPKNKFTREEMIAAALKIVRRNGAGSLTAKAIADELGISTRPVFTCFGTMDTVKNEVRQAAEEIYNRQQTEAAEHFSLCCIHRKPQEARL